MVVHCASGVLDTDVIVPGTFLNIMPCDIFGGWMLPWSAGCMSALVVYRHYHINEPPMYNIFSACTLALNCTLVFEDVFCPALTRFLDCTYLAPGRLHFHYTL